MTKIYCDITECNNNVNGVCTREDVELTRAVDGCQPAVYCECFSHKKIEVVKGDHDDGYKIRVITDDGSLTRIPTTS